MHDKQSAQRNAQLCTLSELCAYFEELVSAGEFDAARAVFTENPLDIWFGIPTDRLSTLLAPIVEADPNRFDAVYGIHMFIQPAGEGRGPSPHVLRMIEQHGGAHSAAFQTLQMYGHRVAGRPVEALEGLKNQAQHAAALQPFVNSNDGWPLFHSLQRGFTAMLAGDNNDALSAFEEAKLRRQIQRLSTLSKDAWAKSALTHAAWGDPLTAQAYLARAQEFEDSGSWAEDTIDVHIVLAEVLLNSDPQQAYETLKTVDLNNVGEVWPFYAYVVFHTYQRVGARSQVEHQLQQLQSLPFPRETGQGFTGSVFPLTLAVHELFAGRGQAAKDLLRQADQSIVVVQLCEALIEAHTGNPKRALQLTGLTRKETVGLRQLDLLRLAIEATAHYTLADEQALLATLKQALNLPRSLHAQETLAFPLRIRTFAQKHLADWPQAEATDGFFDLIPESTMHFTNRELDVLRHLRQGLTRAEIAEKLFLSVNTVKTQVTSLYRKLEVSSREEALSAADRLGLD